MKLSENIKNIRKENNLSQEQLAEKLGVSRQAVSKWESGQSYPEMDKVLLICKLFNYNIDELMNNNVKEVNETKQSKINFNKYVADFFDFITKTVNMLSSMTFKQKLKCFIEQIFVILFLVILYGIIGTIGFSFIDGIFGGLSRNVFDIISTIFGTFYAILALAVGVAVFLHIFKIRYLDYYELVEERNETNKEEENANKQEQDNSSENKIILEKKKEKIVIRDPIDSSSRILAGIVKIALLCIKFFVFWCAVGFSFTFVGLVIGFVLSFLFVKTGFVFWGAFLGLTSAIVINFIVLEICYNFIVNRTFKKTRTAITLIISLLSLGLSIGLFMIGMTTFDYSEETETNNEIEDEYSIPMTENLAIYGFYNTEYIENDSEDIKIVVKHSKYYTTAFSNENDNVYIHYYADDFSMELLRNMIEDINNKKIINYYHPTMYIYTSKNNIEKLKQNKQVKEQVEEEHELAIDTLYDELYDLQDLTKELYTQIDSLQEQLNEQYTINEELEEKLLETVDF